MKIHTYGYHCQSLRLLTAAVSRSCIKELYGISLVWYKYYCCQTSGGSYIFSYKKIVSSDSTIISNYYYYSIDTQIYSSLLDRQILENRYRHSRQTEIGSNSGLCFLPRAVTNIYLKWPLSFRYIPFFLGHLIASIRLLSIYDYLSGYCKPQNPS